MNKPFKSFTFAVLAAAAFAEAGATELSDLIARDHKIIKTDIWYGGQRTVFDFEGYEAWVVEPPEGVRRAEGNPWTWTMQWATAYVPRTSVPRFLKEKGWLHATILTFKDRMDEQGLKVSASYQKYLVGTLGFAPKACLIGMSWGGFFSVRYAANFPANVSRIYLDCPFLNFYGCEVVKDIGSWKDRVPADGNWMDDPEMPINIYPPIIKAGIPVLLLYGGHDQTLKPALNSELFLARFKRDGGDIKVIRRPLYGHHPHGVEIDEDTIIDFFTAK